ncbi:MAG: 50S ribosomal protein L6 [Gammaproteobacteria bacterium]
MSRIAKQPIPLPTGVSVTMSAGAVAVKGAKGELRRDIPPAIRLVQEDGELKVHLDDDSGLFHAMSGTVRALLKNMVTGVSKGFERKLTLVGVGYRAQVQGKSLNLTLGFSHPVSYPVPEGIVIETPSQTEILIKGIDKQKVGQVAADIRAYRPPEPYKGKGVRYADEQVILKEAKKK